MSDSLREGTDGFIHVLLLDGHEVMDTAGYTFTASAKFKDGPDGAFAVAVTSEPGTDPPLFRFTFAAADLDQEGTLEVEWTPHGSPLRNPPSEPILVPVRAAL